MTNDNPNTKRQRRILRAVIDFGGILLFLILFWAALFYCVIEIVKVVGS